MPNYHKDIADARAVTLETRAAAQLRLQESSVAGLLPDTYEDTQRFELNVNERSGVASASFRSFDTEAPFGSEPTTFSLSGRIPAISQKLRLTERERFVETAQAREAVLSKARSNGFAVATRSILARGQVLETGKLTLDGENGIQDVEIDFARPAAHTVTAAASWATATTDILSDLIAWQETYRAANGVNPERVIVSTRVMGALTKNEAIIAATGAPTGTKMVSPDMVRGVLASWGFTNIIVNDEVATDRDGVDRRVISDNVVLFLPAAGGVVSGLSIGSTTWGTPAEAMNPEYGLGAGSERAGLFGGAFVQSDPEALYVLGSAVMLPVLTNATATFAATVFVD